MNAPTVEDIIAEGFNASIAEAYCDAWIRTAGACALAAADIVASGAEWPRKVEALNAL